MSVKTLGEAAALVNGLLEGDASIEIRGVASLADADAGEITFYANPRYAPVLRSSKAGAVLVPRDFAEDIEPARIRVDDPAASFAKLLEDFAPTPVVYPPGIHPTAIIAADAVIAPDAAIQPFVVIEAGVVIGSGTVIGAHGFVGLGSSIGVNCIVYPNVTIRERSKIGNRVILHPGVVIGSDGFGYEMVNGKHVKVPQTGIVQIDDDVELGSNTTVDRARFGRTWIRHGAKIDNQVMIAHNVVVGPHSILCAQVGISGSSRLGSYVTLAGQVGIAGHVEIGDQVVLGARSGVAKNMPNKGVYMGAPAEPIQEHKKRFAQTGRIKSLGERVKRLEALLQK